MIVNTAYPFMGKKGPTVNPNIWGDGVVNYQYSGDAKWQAANNRFQFYVGYKLNFVLPLSGFTKLRFTANSSGSTDGLVRIYITGDRTTMQSYVIPMSGKTMEFTIPEKYRKDNISVTLEDETAAFYVNSGMMI